MAISHLCITCGLDLARTRAAREPRYGLPLVICPGCGTPAVRRRHPIAARGRMLRRVARSLIALLLQATAACGLMAAVTGACIGLVHALLFWGLDLDWKDEGALIVGGLIVLVLALGAWLTAGLAHWRLGAAWALFGLIAVLILAGDSLIAPAVSQLAALGGLTHEVLDYQMVHFVLRLVLLCAIMLAATAGIPLGKGILLALQRFRGWRWRARRRRLRRRRTA
jgi:hypothetical protein